MAQGTQRKRKRKRRVEEPLTNELLKELLGAPDPQKFLAAHGNIERSLPDYLQQLLDEKGLMRSKVLHNADINPTYGYEIFMGRKNASRDKILQIIFALGCTLQEANRVLQAAHHNELYCKSRRDTIIIFCLDRGYSLKRTNDELYRFNEATIC